MHLSGIYFSGFLSGIHSSGIRIQGVRLSGILSWINLSWICVGGLHFSRVLASQQHSRSSIFD